LSVDIDRFFPDSNCLICVGDILAKYFVNRVVLEKMGESFGVGKVVDSNKIYFFIVPASAQYHPTDPAKAIDRYFDYHLYLPLEGLDEFGVYIFWVGGW